MKLKSKVIIPVVSVVAAAGIGAGAYFATTAMGKDKQNDAIIPYAQGVVVMDSGDVDPAPKGSIALRYKYQAHSSDGINFSCRLGNDAANAYDLYFDIYADADLTDRIFLSGLIPPGTALEEVTLLHELPVGTTTAYVAFNQVDVDEEGNQALLNQTLVTVDFIVSG